jgi:hypothetical protein
VPADERLAVKSPLREAIKSVGVGTCCSLLIWWC